MAGKKRKARMPPPSFSELLGPAGLHAFLNPDDPKVKKQREHAADLVINEFARILTRLDEQKKRQRLLRKLATSGESP